MNEGEGVEAIEQAVSEAVGEVGVTRPLPRVAAAAFQGGWCMEAAAFGALVELVERRAILGMLKSESEIAQIRASQTEYAALSVPSVPGGSQIAVIPIHGVLSHRIGGIENASQRTTAMEAVARAVRDARNNSQIGAVVLDIDSPGGSVAGTPELAEEVWATRVSGKRIVAVANSLAASAAYWVGSQAHEFIATPSGTVGSIGILAVHVDKSAQDERAGIKRTIISAGKYKAQLHGPMNDEALAAIQENIDTAYGMFVDAVARGRGVATSAVRNGMGEGRSVNASQAKSLKMVDRVASLDDVIKGLVGEVTKAERRASLRAQLAERRPTT